MHFVRYSGFYERGGNKEEMNMKIMAKILLEHNLDVASNWRGWVCLFLFSSRNHFSLTCQRTVLLCMGEGVTPATSTVSMLPP